MVAVKPKSGKRHNAKTNLKLHSIVLLPVIQKFVDGLGRSLAIGCIHYWRTLSCSSRVDNRDNRDYQNNDKINFCFR